MTMYVGCDAHKRYSMFAVVTEKGFSGPPVRVEHERGLFRRYLDTLRPGTAIAVETGGSWYRRMPREKGVGKVNPLGVGF